MNLNAVTRLSTLPQMSSLFLKRAPIYVRLFFKRDMGIRGAYKLLRPHTCMHIYKYICIHVHVYTCRPLCCLVTTQKDNRGALFKRAPIFLYGSFCKRDIAIHRSSLHPKTLIEMWITCLDPVSANSEKGRGSEWAVNVGQRLPSRFGQSRAARELNLVQIVVEALEIRGGLPST